MAEVAADRGAAPDPASHPKFVELDALRRQLAPLGFGMRLVPADGNCLFRVRWHCRATHYHAPSLCLLMLYCSVCACVFVQAVADQLFLLGDGSATPAASSSSSSGGGGGGADYLPLRRRAADYILAHADAFAPFLPYEPSDGYPEGEDAATPAATRAAVGRYCARMGGATSAWGGHPEIRALACSLGLPIELFTASGAPIEFTPEGGELRGGAAGEGRRQWPDSARLRLSFHRYYYALGEHYNSVCAVGRADPAETPGGGGAEWSTR